MESTTTSRSSTSTRIARITDSGSVERVRETLRTVAEGLEEVRDRARQEIDAIDRLMSALDTDSLTGVVNMMETLSEEIQTLERRLSDNEAAREEDARALEEEKARLTKLWDAYKAQEEELRRAKRDEPILRERLADRERFVAELEDEIVRLKANESYKERYQALTRDHERLRESYRHVEGDLQSRNDTIAELEAKVESFKSFEGDPKRLKELERQLTEEKERLAKLYKVYEDTEGKLRESEDESARWRQWYDRHRAAFEMVGDAAQYPVKSRPAP